MRRIRTGHGIGPSGRRRRDEHEGLDEVGMLRRHEHRLGAAERVADEHGPPDAASLEVSREPARFAGGRVVPGPGAVREPEAGQVDRDRGTAGRGRDEDLLPARR